MLADDSASRKSSAQSGMRFISIYNREDGFVEMVGSDDLTELEQDLKECFDEGLILIRCYQHDDTTRNDDRIIRSANA